MSLDATIVETSSPDNVYQYLGSLSGNFEQ